MTPDREVRLAVDIGGTFTDVAIELDGRYVTAKRLTTTEEPMAGVIDAIRVALGRAGLTPVDVNVVLQHGTTLATNAIIERRGAVVGLLVTDGFRDVLEIAYERRYDQYDLGSHRPDPLVPRRRCYPVRERVDADGSVHAALDESTVRAAIEQLRSDGVQSVAVGLINAFANPAHEQAIARLLERHCPDLPLSLSSDISPEMREYDRLSTTVANAYIKPLMTRLISEFEQRLRAEGFDCPLLIMTSAGGMTGVDGALRFPIRLLESGPSGGAILAGEIASAVGAETALSFDMGGTTAKVCIIEGRPHRTRELEVGRAARAMKGSGLPVRIPAIDIIEIGSGGGSIARVEPFRGLLVGPDSAGAEPGPAAYGRGGAQPTVTDADFLLGYLDADDFGDGDLTLSRPDAETAFARLVDTLGVDGADCAYAVRNVVEESMANAARVHGAERGVELSTSTLIAFGGNGPLHAVEVARRVGIRRVVIPPTPGVGSAIGFLCAPVAHETVRSRYTLLDALDAEEIEQMLSEMDTEARGIVESGGGTDIAVSRTAFMRYKGQGHEIEVGLPVTGLTAGSVAELRAEYEKEYSDLFGRVPAEMAIEVTNWAVAATTAGRRIALTPAHDPDGDEPAGTSGMRGKRSVYLGRSLGSVDAPLYHRPDLRAGVRIPGPALIGEPQTTTYVPPGAEAAVDDLGAIHIDLAGGQ